MMPYAATNDTSRSTHPRIVFPQLLKFVGFTLAWALGTVAFLAFLHWKGIATFPLISLIEDDGLQINSEHTSVTVERLPASVRFDVHIRNRTERPVTIVGAMTGCDCIAMGLPLTIGANDGGHLYGSITTDGDFDRNIELYVESAGRLLLKSVRIKGAVSVVP